MEQNEYDSEYDQNGMFLLFRSNDWGIAQSLALSHDYSGKFDQYFVELGLSHTYHEMSTKIRFPLTENDIDQLILKLQTMKEELIKRNTK